MIGDGFWGGNVRLCNPSRASPAVLLQDSFLLAALPLASQDGSLLSSLHLPLRSLFSRVSGLSCILLLHLLTASSLQPGLQVPHYSSV